MTDKVIRSSFLLWIACSLLLAVSLSCSSLSTSSGYQDDDSKCGIYPPPPPNFTLKRIAIIPFADKTNQKLTKTDLGSQAVDIATSLLVNSDRFIVVERDRLDALLAEQKLVGIVDPKTAAKAGKVLGVDLIFTGALTDFEVKRTKEGGHFGLPRIGKMPSFDVGKSTEVVSITMAIDGRIIETSTALVIFAGSGEIKREEKAEAWRFGLEGAHVGTKGAVKIEETAAGKQLRFCLDNLIKKIIPRIDTKYGAPVTPAITPAVTPATKP
jgi:curli biogenesis system outer membrane secretion channel CsgG